MPKRPSDPGETTETSQGQPDVAYRYVGAGAFLSGIPARDLTSADVATLDVELIESSGLYEKVV